MRLATHRRLRVRLRGRDASGAGAPFRDEPCWFYPDTGSVRSFGAVFGMRRLGVGVIVGVLAVAPVLGVPASVAATVPVWSVVSYLPSTAVTLFGVSCVSATSCEAVGEKGNYGPTFVPFTESWNGDVWSVVPSRGSAGSQLTDVSCVSAVWCLAVGYTANDSAALTESWNGHGWSVVPNPSPGTGSLSGVSCVSRTFCVAVGGRSTGTSAEMWNGHAWNVVRTPNPANVTFDFFDAVSCVSRQACVAVGQYEGTNQDGTLTLGQFIESWNGKAWSIVPPPQLVSDLVRLDDVSCASATSCVAVGLFEGGGGTAVARTLIERWNGKVWSVQPSRNRGIFNELTSISCVSAVSCQAVGGDGTRQLIESWNGHTWSIVPNPSRQGVNSGLIAVSCVSVTSCKGVGDAELIESYG